MGPLAGGRARLWPSSPPSSGSLVAPLNPARRRPSASRAAAVRRGKPQRTAVQPGQIASGEIGLLAAFGSVARPGRRLIADTGASMHAVGDKELLQHLELWTNPKSVEMANGTVEDVIGVGRIEWGPFSIPNVYLVKGLQTSLISISQLDSDHGMHSCFGKGKCEIMLADGTVVGAAILDKNGGMYVLRFLEVPELEPETTERQPSKE